MEVVLCYLNTLHEYAASLPEKAALELEEEILSLYALWKACRLGDVAGKMYLLHVSLVAERSCLRLYSGKFPLYGAEERKG